MNARTRWAVIGRGWVGWHGESADGSSRGSGGDLAYYLQDAIPGALVYDASEADAAAFSRWVHAGPMIDPSLPPGTVSRFGSYPKNAEPVTSRPRALDNVAVDVWERLARQDVPGIRWGRVKGRSVIWEEPLCAACCEGPALTGERYCAGCKAHHEPQQAALAL